jgi:coenzyme Q-binding protein COQ10
MHVFETNHRVAHSADNMFALVARIEDYPKFLPLCEALAIKCRERSGSREVLIATMTVGYRLIRESFTTRVALDNAAREILVEYLDGPFAHLENRWHFIPFAEAACEVSFYIAYSFRSRLFERLVGGLFAKAVHKYTEAFEARADAVYGREDASAIASQQ